MPKLLSNVREDIILVAKEMLLEQGLKAVNVRDIAKKCEIGTGTFYNYFANKNELLMGIFREDWTKIIQLSHTLEGNDTIAFKEKLRTIDSSLSEFVVEYIDTFFEMATVKGKHSCQEVNKFDPLYDSLSKMIDHEKEKGVITSSLDSKKLAQFIVSNILYMNRNKYISFDELYDCLNL